MSKYRILVVDDERDVTDNLSKLLARKFDSEVQKAYNGQEALDKIKAASFDLVILDIKMPGLSGIDVIKEARKIQPAIKILSISAYDSKEVADEALKAGALDYVHKQPHLAETIASKIKDVLGSGQ